MKSYWLAGLLFTACAVQAKPVITWLQADLKPYFINEGSLKGQGGLDLAQQQLLAAMPQYQHQLHWLSLLRREQEMQQAQGTACAFALLKTPERQHYQYSLPITAAAGYAAVMLAEGKLYQRWLAAGDADIASWLAQQRDITGLMEAGRAAPDFIRHLTDGSIITYPLQTNPVALLAHGRADYWLEYPARANYLRSQYDDNALKLNYIYLQQEASLSYVVCSPATPVQVMQDINLALQQLIPQSDYQQNLYLWTDAATLPQLLQLYQEHVLLPLQQAATAQPACSKDC